MDPWAIAPYSKPNKHSPASSNLPFPRLILCSTTTTCVRSYLACVFSSCVARQTPPGWSEVYDAKTLGTTAVFSLKTRCGEQHHTPPCVGAVRHFSCVYCVCAVKTGGSASSAQAGERQPRPPLISAFVVHPHAVYMMPLVACV